METLPLVLAPGMLCDERLFVPQRAALGGERTCRVADLTLDDSVEAMAERLLSEAPDGPFALAGLSLGGIVAMEVVRQAPTRVARLALMATNHRAAGPDFIATRTQQIARALQGDLRSIVIDEMKGLYLAEGHPDARPILALVLDMALACGPAVFARQARALMGRRDQSDTLARYTGPTLLLCGREDRLCPVETHRAMAALLARASVVVVERCGHLVTLERPDAATRALRTWITA